MTDILMPALSPTMEEGTLAKWLVKVGQAVKSGDVIAEIETDKATMEVEAVDEGVVAALLVPEGTEGVKVNAPIARLEGEGEAAAPPSPSEPALGTESGPPSGPTNESVRRPEGGERRSAPAHPIASPPGRGGPPTMVEGAAPTPAPVETAAPEKAGGRPPISAPGDRIAASPLAKRLAAQLGITLATIKGSGPHGRIIRRDLEGLKSGRAEAAAAPPERVAELAAGSRPVRTLEQMGIAPGSYELVSLDGMRKTVARRMTESFRDVPHFPLTIDIEIDALLAARIKINGLLESSGAKVSVNDLVIKAAAAALKRVPEANASYSAEGIALHRHADIAVAVAVEGGLITPIVRAAETKGVAAIAAEMKDLAQRARGRKLKPEEYQGGTFSVSNLGMFGVKSFASILNEPQGAILSVGAGEKRPVARGDALAVATVMTVTLTCDHRVVDGAIGARWLAAFKAMIEDPITMIV